MRDTTTVLFNGTTEDQAAWVAFRWVSTPQSWLHATAVLFMGMQQTLTMQQRRTMAVNFGLAGTDHCSISITVGVLSSMTGASLAFEC